MKIGFVLRKVQIKIIGFIRHLRESYYYFKDYFYENSFKKANPSEIKNLLVIQEGAVGDTYNFIGILNELSKNYLNVSIYCLTREQSKSFYKNPRINLITSEIAEKMIKEKKIDALITYGTINHFFKDKKIIQKIPYRAGRLLPYKTRKVPDEILPIFHKLGFKIDDLKFYFTKEGEKAAEDFYAKYNLKKPVVLIQVGSGKTIRALKENKIPSTMWAPENWAKVLGYLIQAHNYYVIFIGVKEEKNLVKEVIQKMSCKSNFLDITGEFSIEEVASIAKRGDLVIGVDSGIIHILSQIGIQVVILFAGDPKISAPYKNSINIWNPKVCSGCRKYYCPEENPVCINDIEPELVINKLPFYY